MVSGAHGKPTCIHETRQIFSMNRVVEEGDNTATFGDTVVSIDRDTRDRFEFICGVHGQSANMGVDRFHVKI